MKFLIIVFSFISSFGFAQINGCTDLEAKNYHPNAIINDGSCLYQKLKISPEFSILLNDSIHESSGLISWKKKLWTINDDSDTHIYSFDFIGTHFKKHQLKNLKNKDWEALTQDSLHIYIGDFGNNVSGNRKDLHILKIEKQSLLENNPKIDTIAFSFEDQYNFDKLKSNKTNFDCETILASKDSLYLFTKEWSSRQTRLYVLPKKTGSYQAKFKSSLNVNGLITGGVLVEDKKLIVLCGYSKKLQPFLYLLYDFQNRDFFSGNKRKIKLALPFHQIEGITTDNGLQFYLTNENFQRKPFISVKQQLHKIDLSLYLNAYFSKSTN